MEQASYPTSSSEFPLRKTVIIAAVVWINSFSTLVTAPFLPFMVQDMFGGSLKDEQIGFRSGFVEACYQVGQAIASYLWGSFSDVHGRRPALLMGLLGTAVSTVAFGMSKSFGALCFIRFVWGALNGNIGVSKSALSEILPYYHQARGFGFIGMAAGFGRLLGPAIGGILARPAESGVAAFDTAFLREYPYVLPCIVSSCVTCVTLICCYFAIEETLVSARSGWWNSRMRAPGGGCGAGAGQAPEESASMPSKGDYSRIYGGSAGAPGQGRRTGTGLVLVDGSSDEDDEDDGSAIDEGDDEGGFLMHDRRTIAASVAPQTWAQGRYAGSKSHVGASYARAAEDSSSSSDDSIEGGLVLLDDRDGGQGPENGEMQGAAADLEEQEIGEQGCREQGIRRAITATYLAARSDGRSAAAPTLARSQGPRFAVSAQANREGEEGDEDEAEEDQGSAGACELLSRRRVFAPAALYGGLAFVALAGNEALPLQALNDAQHGGFGFRARDIGLCITLVGPVLLVYQVFVYPKVVEAMGLLGSTNAALVCFSLSLALTPWLGLLAPYSSWVHWTGLMVVIVLTTVCRVTAFINTFQLVANATSSAKERGKVNGIAQSFAAAGRVVAPPFGTMVFAYFAGLNRGWPLNWHAMWIMLSVAALGVLGIARTVPEENERTYLEGKGGKGGAAGRSTKTADGGSTDSSGYETKDLGARVEMSRVTISESRRSDSSDEEQSRLVERCDVDSD